MTIERIISGSGAEIVRGDSSREISLVCDDSRKAVPGSLFVAVKGFASDGHNYIAKALENGACAVVYEDQEAAEAQIAMSGKEDIVMIRTASSRHSLGMIASNFYDNPAPTERQPP